MSQAEVDARFAALYETRAGALMRYGYVLTGNRHDAADLVQEAFIRLRVAWRRVANKSDPEGYLRVTMARLTGKVGRYRVGGIEISHHAAMLSWNDPQHQDQQIVLNLAGIR